MAKKRTTSESRKRMMTNSHQNSFERKLRNKMRNDDRTARNTRLINEYIGLTGDRSIIKTKTARRAFLDSINEIRRG